tara:strand:+ start:185 stop:745 length:561 start_codon:yes stop_codon:yes gene_type:complete
MKKWIVISLGSLIGVSHIGMIGMLATRSRLPVVNLPVGPYTSYSVEAGKNGYRIDYKANDPKIMRVERNIKKKGGFLGLGNNIVQVTEEYTMDGSKHLSSNKGSQDENGGSFSNVECIEAVGGGKQTGRLVGGSIGGAVANTGLASIPYVGWVLAGAATMIGMDQGADIGGQMAEDLSKHCEEDIK